MNPAGRSVGLHRVAGLLGAVHRRVGVGNTVHALPFDAMGAVLALRSWQGWAPLILFLLCILFGRATVVGFLRFFEAPPTSSAPSR